MDDETHEALKAKIADQLVRMTQAIYAAKRLPSGHLYDLMMNEVTLRQYEILLDLVLETGLVRREPGHLLVWVGYVTNPTFSKGERDDEEGQRRQAAQGRDPRDSAAGRSIGRGEGRRRPGIRDR